MSSRAWISIWVKGASPDSLGVFDLNSHMVGAASGVPFVEVAVALVILMPPFALSQYAE